MLRYDTPPNLRWFDESDGVFMTAWVCAWLVGAFDLVFGVMAVDEGAWSVLVVLGAATAAYLSFLGWMAHHRWALRRWHVDVGGFMFQVASAHYAYDQLSPDGQAHAAPLIEAMYRIAQTRTVGTDARQKVTERLQRRVAMIEAMVEDEGRMLLATESVRLEDEDDLESVELWRQAMAEVAGSMEAQSRGEPAPPARRRPWWRRLTA